MAKRHHHKGAKHHAKHHVKHHRKAHKGMKGHSSHKGRKGHKISAKQRAAMTAGRNKWLRSTEGKAWRAYMSELRKGGKIGRGSKGKHAARGKAKGSFMGKTRSMKKTAKGHAVEHKASRGFQAIKAKQRGRKSKKVA